MNTSDGQSISGQVFPGMWLKASQLCQRCVNLIDIDLRFWSNYAITIGALYEALVALLGYMAQNHQCYNEEYHHRSDCNCNDNYQRLGRHAGWLPLHLPSVWHILVLDATSNGRPVIPYNVVAHREVTIVPNTMEPSGAMFWYFENMPDLSVTCGHRHTGNSRAHCPFPRHATRLGPGGSSIGLTNQFIPVLTGINGYLVDHFDNTIERPLRVIRIISTSGVPIALELDVCRALPIVEYTGGLAKGGAHFGHNRAPGGRILFGRSPVDVTAVHTARFDGQVERRDGLGVVEPKPPLVLSTHIELDALVLTPTPVCRLIVILQLRLVCGVRFRSKPLVYEFTRIEIGGRNAYQSQCPAVMRVAFGYRDLRSGDRHRDGTGFANIGIDGIPQSVLSSRGLNYEKKVMIF
ncbi:unnamed protein product [Oppiella nova]|uniref:Uncharacterized protein n=1 Tax=Oppiella nova TaxID=334625 RepID=A0A7R9QBA7_9ACAR|nr:unnamed protein product [Oppiella nova]CAG2162243.1 unnamed protein product [Oppiella nova]